MAESRVSHAHEGSEAAEVAVQFDDLEQQQEASNLGMWIFLATEVLFFGGLFLVYTVYRITYTADFAAISRHINATLGTVNTAVLLTSSFSVALAVEEAKKGASRRAATFLAATVALAVLFLGVKGYEYYLDFHEHLIPGDPAFPYVGNPSMPQQLFIWIYYAMTGLHAFHVTIGIGLLSWMTLRAWRGEFNSPARHHVVHIAGLYWHFVDAIWVFLYPLLYLLERHTP